jgi:hypothetical protein
MDITIPIRGKPYDFPLWTNKLQKQILLSISKENSIKDNVDSLFLLLNRYPELLKLHYIDKMYILLKSREYSVGNIVEDIIICNNCQMPTSANYKL